MSVKSTYFPIFILLLLVSCSQPETQSSSLEQKLDEQFAHLSQTHRPGFAIGVIQKGEILLNKGYGVANVEHDIPFTGESVSDIGSVAKHITASGILTLADQGKLSLEAPVAKYLPELVHFDSTLTIRHLITHTSGMPDVYALVALRGWRGGDLMDQNYALRFMKGYKALDFKPGDQFMYSNTAYMLLAEIISRVGDMEFEVWMREHLFKPLNMNHTFVMDKQGEIYPMMAESYGKGEDGNYYRIFDNSTLQGAGGMYSSITDMLAWLDNFRTAKVPAVRLLNQRAVLNNGDTLDYALGVNIDSYRGLKRISHSGSSAGYRTKMFYYPKSQTGLIVKSNTPELNYEQISKIENLVLEELFDELEALPEETKEDADKPFNAGSGNDLEAFAGKYLCRELDLIWNIGREEKALIISTYYTDSPPFKRLGKDEFSPNGGATSIVFESDSTGSVSGFTFSEGRVKALGFERME